MSRIIYKGVGARGNKPPISDTSLVHKDSKEFSWPLLVQLVWRVQRERKKLELED
jgi:hypothetical protein